MFAKRTIRQSIGISAAISLLLCAVMLILVMLATRSTQAQPAPLPPIAPVLATVDPPIEYAPGIVIVKLKPNITLLPNQETTAAHSAMSSNHADLAQAMQAIGVIGSEPLFTLSTITAAGAASDVRGGFARTYRLQLAPAADVSMAVDILRANAAIEYAEPDYVAHAALIPNDPEWDNQWALHKINAPAAWNLTQGATTTVIALIDSGIDLTHPDLSGRLWQNDDTPGNGVDDDQNGKIDDVNGWNFVTASNNVAATNDHGTQVAGVAGAAGNNSLGVAGLCWDCPLMPVVAMQANGVANYSTIANAVAYAAANGAAVINLSLGGYADSSLLRETIQEAATTAVVVAAVGNDDDVTPFYPAAYPDVIAVAATDATDQKTIFSNYGPWVDIAAPGAEILTTTPGDYASPSGTSVAAPFVAGVAGLLKSLHPDWSPTLITWQILNTATTIDAINPTYLGQLGHGRLDAGAALAQPLQARVQVESYTVDGQVNGRPAPGQSFPLVLTLRNTWMPGQNVMGTLATTDPYVTISDNQGAFSDIAPGQTGQNSSDPFVVTLLPDTPYNRTLTFSINLTGANGYATSVPFTLQVRTAVETLGNTQYTQNTTWTSDKTYILNGTVIVGTGITLTIQPGTVVKGNPSRFIRVDGTLVAQGTAEQPIIFTTNATNSEKWGGLRFTDSAVDAYFDANGNYMSGSVLRFINLSYTDTGINAGTRSPYIADSTFQNNSSAITRSRTNSNSGASIRIERNTFNANSLALGLNGGSALIRQNTFSNNNSGLTGGGSFQIINNRFTNNTGTAISLNCCNAVPLIRDNIITNNGAAIYASELQYIDIDHNLIANNSTPGTCMPPCGISSGAVSVNVPSGIYSQSNPSLIYNAHLDEYLLAWTESTGSNSTAWLQKLSYDGQPLEKAIALYSNPHYSNALSNPIPKLLYNPDNHEYLVAISPSNAQDDIMLQRLTEDGKLIGAPTIIATTSVYQVRVVYQSGDNTYLIAWASYSCNYGCVNHLFAQRVAADGILLGDIIAIGDDIADSNMKLGDITYDPHTQRSLVSFRTDAQPSKIYGDWVIGNSAPYSSTLLYQDPESRSLQNPTMAFSASTARFMSLWERDGSLNSSIPRPLFGVVTAADGSTVVSQTVVYTGPAAAYNPQLAYNSTADQFMVVWAQNPMPAGLSSISQLQAQRIGSDGVLIGTPITIKGAPPSGMMETNVATPVLAYNTQQNEYLLAWVDQRQSTNVIFGQRVSTTGQLLDNTWSAANESNPSVNFRLTTPFGIRHNTIINNAGYGIRLSSNGMGAVTISQNNLFGNGQYDLYLGGSSPGTQNFTVDVTNNFWDIDTSAIASRIYDCTFDENGCGSSSSTLGKVQYDPSLTEPSQNAPAFVYHAEIDPDPVGLNQVGTATIDFSRPMITETLPILTFYDARRGNIKKIASNYARDITQDAIGRIWFGTQHGANMFDGRQWYTYTTTSSGLGNNNINAVYGTDNGDVWFGSEMMSAQEAPISRLQGSTWITYNQVPNINQGPILAISQDTSGAIWVSSAGRGVFRFDGIAWQQFTTADGLSSNYVRRIVRDGQSRMWFMSGIGMNQNDPGGLDVFDGVHWQTYNRATGMPTNAFAALFADSQGRVWTSIGSIPNQQSCVAMFDGIVWHFFGPSETYGRLSCPVNHFSEAPDGTIWMSGFNGTITYRSGIWQNLTSTPAAYLIDRDGNFWYNDMRVRWGGLDYPFENGQWLSPTRYQSTYNFTAQIPQGIYTVDVSGASAADNMDVVPGTADTFRVDFGLAANPTPPFTPAVAAENDGTLTTLTASWHTDSPDIDQYRYAIGTSAGARNVVGWTYLTATSMTRNDLVLSQGQPYYVSVQARNKFGLWSATGTSNQVLGGVVTTVPTATPATTSGPTPTGTISTPTPTPTGIISTPTPTPVGPALTLSSPRSGAPGSRFVMVGSGFPANTQLPAYLISDNGMVIASEDKLLTTILTDAVGNFALTTSTLPSMAPGVYTISVGDTPRLSVQLTIDPAAPLQLPPVNGLLIELPPVIDGNYQLFLPVIVR